MTDNPYLKRLAQAETQSPAYRRAPKQERKLAQRANGRQTSASGSGFRKGDVQVNGIARIEAKTTQNASFSVTREMIRKIEMAGMSSDEIPAIVVEFLDHAARPVQEIAIIPVTALLALIERAKR